MIRQSDVTDGDSLEAYGQMGKREERRGSCECNRGGTLAS